MTRAVLTVASGSRRFVRVVAAAAVCSVLARPTAAAADAPSGGGPTAGFDRPDAAIEDGAAPTLGVPADEVAETELEARVRDLEQRLADSQDAAERRRPIVTWGGYIDLGFFMPQGNGGGVVADLGPAESRAFPQYAGRYGWVFLGDLLAPAVNTRGEPADLGNLPGVDRQDTINSGGAPGFIANEVNFTAQAAVLSNALATASVNFLPRTGREFRLGDVFDVDLAQVEWMPGVTRRWSIFAGKMESVFGIEYRERKARDRFGITPSLVARYTTGTPVGVKVRGKMGRGDWLIVAIAMTNGSTSTETFHFYDEVDSNAGKTASGRLAVAPWDGKLEVGVSGSWGAQDHARDSRDAMWLFGADVQFHRRGFGLKGQWLMGRAPGERAVAVYDPDHRPYGLRLNGGAYLEADWMATPFFGLWARGEFRDALVWLGDPNAPLGAERLYVTKSWRGTFGVRVVPGEHVALKAEVLRNGEYGGVPSIPNDVFVASLVLSY